jgi:hypothetical protein
MRSSSRAPSADVNFDYIQEQQNFALSPQATISIQPSNEFFRKSEYIPVPIVLLYRNDRELIAPQQEAV